MTLAGDSQTRFSELEQLEIAEYRPVNRGALIAFALGWISAVALTHRVLCIVPLVAAILAVIALRQLGLAENKQSGRSLAVMGLGLALLFGSWAVARETSREMQLLSQARPFAERWFELVRDGKLYEAHQLTVAEETRAAEGISLTQHYRKPPAVQKRAEEAGAHGHPEDMMEMSMHPSVEFDHFFGQHAAQHIKDLGKEARVEFLRNGQVLNINANTVQVDLVFEVHEGSADQSQSYPITIALIRTWKPGLAADWRVASLTDEHSH